LRIKTGLNKVDTTTTDEQLLNLQHWGLHTCTNTDEKTDTRRYKEPITPAYLAHIDSNPSVIYGEEDIEDNYETRNCVSCVDVDAPISIEKDFIRVTLLRSSLWRTFHAEGTEMIINKSGR